MSKLRPPAVPRMPSFSSAADHAICAASKIEGVSEAAVAKPAPSRLGGVRQDPPWVVSKYI